MLKNKINSCLPIALIFGLTFLSNGLSGQEQKKVYVDPYLVPIDTGTAVNMVYPPLTEREGKDLDIPVPPKEHPRLFFRAKDIPALKEKINNPLMADCWKRIVENATLQTDGKLQRDGAKHNMDNRIINTIEAKAFMYAFQKNQQAGKAAVDAVMNYHKTFVIDHNKADVCRDIGRVILMTAIVYDWCYDLIDLQDKKWLITRMENLGKQLEIVWPKLVQGSIVGHGSEAQLGRDMLSCAIATYDEKPEIYHLAAGRIFAEFIPARKFFYPAAYHHQGSSYGPYRYVWDLWITLIFDKIGYPVIMGDNQAKIPYRWIYSRRPDGQFFRDGDDFNELYTDFGKPWTIAGCAITGSYFKDPVLMGEAIDKKQIGRDGLFDFLLIDPTVQAKKDLSGLPLTKYFQEPLGAMVARNGWSDDINSNTVVAEMKIGVFNYVNHQHLDAGSFQIYYKGPLAVQSGIYQGKTGGYGCEHFFNYYQRSIAHNTMLIFNPDEKFTWHGREIMNDGGQQFPNDAAEPKNMQEFMANDYKTGEVLSHGFGPDLIKPEYSYLKGELAEAYSDKVKSFKRSFVFLNLNDAKIPAALIVFDRVISSNKDFKKTWLLHCVEEPEISGNTAIVKRTEKGYNGLLINTTLLPGAENLSIQKVGGKDNEYTVNGKNFPQYPYSEKNSTDGAIWRLEVSPKNANNTDLFLNVMQVMDANGNAKSLAVEKLETEKFIGAKIGDRIVFFSKDGEINNQSFSLKISGEGTFSVLIADLQKGKWKVENQDGEKAKVFNVKDQENLLVFSAEKGNYTINKE
ncbi:MAG: heparinase [Mariniphaga sp.]|nr:heparinase [Mariniphaga sp.]